MTLSKSVAQNLQLLLEGERITCATFGSFKSDKFYTLCNNF